MEVYIRLFCTFLVVIDYFFVDDRGRCIRGGQCGGLVRVVVDGFGVVRDAAPPPGGEMCVSTATATKQTLNTW